MLTDAQVAATIPTQNMDKARNFYEDKLKLSSEMEMSDGSVLYRCKNGTAFALFPSSGAADGSFTQMGFWVNDVEAEVRDLKSRGVVFEEYEMGDFNTVDSIATVGDWKGAWFKDPDGNLISIGEGPALDA